MLDKATVINTAKKYANAVVSEFSPNAIILYGSYVNGNPNKDSDIDIAVVFDDFRGDRLETSAKLWSLTRNISTYIEPVLLDTTKDKSGFTEYIMKIGEYIYKAA